MTDNEKLINRPEYIKKLNQWKNQEDLVKIITGVRRCGKSKLFVLFQNELLKEDGIFITSGIINTMEEAVKEAMLANNFEILEINHMKDWVSITAKPKR